MKKLIILVSFAALGFLSLSIDDSLHTLGITRETAQQYIASGLQQGFLQNPVSWSKIGSSLRAEIAGEVIRYAKEYTSTDAFRQSYSAFRTSKKPTLPEKPKTAAETMKEMQDDIKAKTAELEEQLKTTPQEQKQYIQAAITQMKQYSPQQMTPEQMAQFDTTMNSGYKTQLEEYNQKLAVWEHDFPADPKPFIKMRLQHYLNVHSTVDFSAELKPDAQGMKQFVNQEYEKKSSEWKQCFRAGKEANDAAIKVVDGWIVDLK